MLNLLHLDLKLPASPFIPVVEGDLRWLYCSWTDTDDDDDDDDDEEEEDDDD